MAPLLEHTEGTYIARAVIRNIDMQDAPPVVGQDNEDEQDPTG